jgi:hypothetical protein
VDGHGGSSEWTIAIVVRLRVRCLKEFDLRRAIRAWNANRIQAIGTWCG